MQTDKKTITRRLLIAMPISLVIMLGCCYMAVSTAGGPSGAWAAATCMATSFLILSGYGILAGKKNLNDRSLPRFIIISAANFFILYFLIGKIYDIKKGTPEGVLIAFIGLICTVIVSFITLMLVQHFWWKEKK